ncbi:hypothetical protein pb186bvf_012907 [Paramecium bursaria]
MIYMFTKLVSSSTPSANLVITINFKQLTFLQMKKIIKSRNLHSTKLAFMKLFLHSFYIVLTYCIFVFLTKITTVSI